MSHDIFIILKTIRFKMLNKLSDNLNFFIAYSFIFVKKYSKMRNVTYFIRNRFQKNENKGEKNKWSG